MKITAIKGMALRCKCDPISDALSTSTARQALLVKIETDSGLYGIGEAFTYGAPLPVMKYIVEQQLGPMLIGHEPDDIEKLWDLLYWRTLAHGRRSTVMAGISGIDIALWDLKGKMNHIPVYELLGAVSDLVPTYASGGFYAPGKGLAELREEMEGYLAKGYKHAKMKIGRNLDRPGSPLKYMANQDWNVSVEKDLERIATVRGVLGDGKLIVDTNASWDADTVMAAAEDLRKYKVCWIEEPIPFEDLAGMSRITKELTDIQVIGCETQQGLGNFTTMVKQEALDIVQPDVGWAGGITECIRIGKMAEGAGKAISLHCFGSAVLFAASLHVAAAMPNTEMMESEENPNPLREDIIKSSFETDGQMNVYVPQADGLGIDLDWNKLEEYSIII